MKKNLLIVTNLYPLPWEQNRATFNKQQFDLLSTEYNVGIIVPVAFAEYYKNKHMVDKAAESNIIYIPYFYTPKIGRRHYGHMMNASISIFCDSFIKKFSPDMLLASWVYPEGFVAKELARELNIPYFVKVHGSDVNAHIDNPARVKKIKSVVDGAKGVLSVSKALSKQLGSIGCDTSKHHVVYNGVDHQKFKRLSAANDPKSSKRILYIGNLKKTKGVYELLHSFASVALKDKTLELHYAGPGSERLQLETLAKDLGISDNVIFHGCVDHHKLPELINSARLLCLPSYNEGVPNVVLESISCGIPVVATKVGGIPEIIEDGVNGFLCESQNTLSLTSALAKALSHKWETENVVKSSQVFDWDLNKSQVKDMLEAI